MTPQEFPIRPPREALVLSAGFGTRLRPLSRDKAKAALPVAGVPLARRILTWLRTWGVTSIVMNLHHRPATITRIVGDGSDLGLSVRYSWEDPILGSAGGPRRALSFFREDTFLIVNGDMLTDVNIQAMAERHHRSDALVTMAVIHNPDPVHYGGVLMDDEGRVTGFSRPAADNAGHHFVGIQIAHRSTFESLPEDRAAETVAELYPQLIHRQPGVVRAFLSPAQFADIGTAADYLDTSLEVARLEGHAAPLVGRDSRIDGSARIRDAIVWDRAVVEAGCVLDRVIVGDDVRVPAGSHFSRCAIVVDRGDPLQAGEERRGQLVIAPLGPSHRRPTRPDEAHHD